MIALLPSQRRAALEARNALELERADAKYLAQRAATQAGPRAWLVKAYDRDDQLLIAAVTSNGSADPRQVIGGEVAGYTCTRTVTPYASLEAAEADARNAGALVPPTGLDSATWLATWGPYIASRSVSPGRSVDVTAWATNTVAAQAPDPKPRRSSRRRPASTRTTTEGVTS